MKKALVSSCAIFALAMFASLTQAQLISEFQPNPAGGDPSDTTFELMGAAGTIFDLDIVSIENDGFQGIIDRAANVTGTFDANGLAVVTVPDLENPSFTVLLTDRFDGSIGDDIDAADDGTLDLTNFGTLLDVVGVSDSTTDDGSLYSTILGGVDILFNGNSEPELVFRDGTTGEFYQVASDGTDLNIFSADATTQFATGEFFGGDPTLPSFGSINPTIVAIPEPTAIALLGLAGLGMGLRRRR